VATVACRMTYGQSHMLSNLFFFHLMATIPPETALLRINAYYDSYIAATGSEQSLWTLYYVQQKGHHHETGYICENYKVARYAVFSFEC
jgi:hypothetical protein